MTTAELIAHHFALPSVDPNDTLADCGAGLLDCVALSIEIDDQLGVYIEEDALGLETTCGEVVDLVESKRRAAE